MEVEAAMDEVIVLNDQYFNIGETPRLWHSITFTQNKMHMLCRREKIRGVEECNDPTKFDSKVEHSIYEHGKLLSCNIIDDGEECRTWHQNGQSYALYMHTKHGQMIGYDFRVANLDTGDIRTITKPDEKNLGKNWMPLPWFEEDMAFIKTIFPLERLIVKKDGCEYSSYSGVTVPKSQKDNYSIFRGGSNGLMTEKGWEGYGHTNLDGEHHQPFKWYMEDGKITIEFDQDYSCLDNFNIIDPVSYFSDPDYNQWLSLCCSERPWLYGQRILDVLWPICISNPNGKFIKSMPKIRKDKIKDATRLETFV